MNAMFFINAALLGVGLAMDAFSVSVANGLCEPDMKPGKALAASAVFGGFQTAMPLIGWLCVHLLFEAFESFRRFVPWIAFALLLFIGGKMIYEGLRGEKAKAALGVGALLLSVTAIAAGPVIELIRREDVEQLDRDIGRAYDRGIRPALRAGRSAYHRRRDLRHLRRGRIHRAQGGLRALLEGGGHRRRDPDNHRARNPAKRHTLTA